DQSFAIDDQWTGTCGNTVIPNANGQCTVRFTFLAGQNYTLGLTSIKPPERMPGDPLYVNPALNPNAGGLNVDYVPNDLNTIAGSTELSILYSTTSLNGGTQRAVFGRFDILSPLLLSQPDNTAFAQAGTFLSGDPFLDRVLIAFEDGAFVGMGTDYNDFRVSARVVPTPPLMGGLMVLAALMRRRRQEMVES
ncbi:hypothetical protein C8255_20115, partial [filamentous cyanobacterium CCP3]